MPAFCRKFTIEQTSESKGVSSIRACAKAGMQVLAYRFPQRNGEANPFFGRQHWRYMAVTCHYFASQGAEEAITMLRRQRRQSNQRIGKRIITQMSSEGPTSAKNRSRP